MNALKNKVQLIGRLGNAPEMKTLESGKMMARISIATSETYRKENGERVTDTQWHNLVAWGKLAEIAQKYLQKGSEVMIEGKLTHRDYTDKERVKRFITEVVVNELMMLDKKPQPEATPF
jgi:single-strand binding protein